MSWTGSSAMTRSRHAYRPQDQKRPADRARPCHHRREGCPADWRDEERLVSQKSLGSRRMSLSSSRCPHKASPRLGATGRLRLHSSVCNGPLFGHAPTPFQQGDFKKWVKGPKRQPRCQQRCRPTEKPRTGLLIDREGNSGLSTVDLLPNSPLSVRLLC